MDIVLRVDGSAGRSLGLRDGVVVDWLPIDDRFNRVQSQRSVVYADGADMRISRFARRGAARPQ
jgi:hypothetical protein